MKTLPISIFSMIATLSAFAHADPGQVTVDLVHPGPGISPTFYGLMTEEINHSYDGGLYAELIRNRDFNDDPKQPIYWSVNTTGGGTGNLALDDSVPPSTALKRSLKFSFSALGPQASAAVVTTGYWGIPVYPDARYRASFYAKGDDQLQSSDQLQLRIESSDGKTVFAYASVPPIGPDWKKCDAILTTAGSAPTAGARLVISAVGAGTLWLDQVSLFPPTFNKRPNGNRIDLMQLLADLHPAFLRFPGGNYLEGDTVEKRFDWKNTIGPLENRPGHQGPWGYRSSDGMGLLEFLNWCEDLHMQPLLGVYAGYSLQHIHVGAGKDLEPFVQDALDEVEYCIGDAAATKWGARRAADGHPAPFTLQYVEIGNEDWFDDKQHNGNYEQRFAQFYDAFKAKYPALQLIATAPVHSRTPDLIDDHYYRNSREMERDVHHYDNADRHGPKIFVGEWATTIGRPTPNFGAALADAVWLTGLERNSDLVVMNCYAPLLVNVNIDARQWGTNLIGYDALHSFGSTSYQAQKIFASNMGTTILPVDVVPQKIAHQDPTPPPAGGIGLCTWNTLAQFKDLKVTHAGQTLYAPDFSKGLAGWRPRGGNWSVADNALTQNSSDANCRITTGSPAWQDFTFELKARKISGEEGFQILFHSRGQGNFVAWNVGGWSNTRTALVKEIDNESTALGPSTNVTVDPNRWYDVRIELAANDIKCFLDNKLITEATDVEEPLPPLYASASRADSTGQVILKVVNISSSPQTVQLNLPGASSVDKNGKLILLQGDPKDMNSIDDPMKISPVESAIDNAAPSFPHEFPPYSLSVIRLSVK